MENARPHTSRAPSVELSIVTTLFRSAHHLEEFHRRTLAAAEALGVDFEIVYVNDGSPDDSLDLVLAFARRDPRVVVVDLSRNFGHHMAFMAGIDHARGRRLFLIDVDLQEQPEWLLRFDDEHRRSGADVVFGVQASRQGGALRRWTGSIFYGLFNLVSEIPIPANPCTVRILSRRYAEALCQLRDRNLFLAGNYAWTGFRQVAIPVEKADPRGLTSYTPGALFRLLFTAIASFSAAPLRLIFLLGLMIAGVSSLVGVAILVRKLADPSGVQLGWASLMVSIWFLGGTLIAISGVLGIYVAMIFAETKHRPPYLVREVHGDGEVRER